MEPLIRIDAPAQVVVRRGEDARGLEGPAPNTEFTWPAVVAACASKSFQAVLGDLRMESVDEARIVLVGPAGLVRSAEFRRAEISQLVSRIAGRTLTVELVTAGSAAIGRSAEMEEVEQRAGAAQGSPSVGSVGGPAAAGGTVGGAGTTGGGGGAGRGAPQVLPVSSMSDHPLVRQAAELLGARLIRVERRESGNG